MWTVGADDPTKPADPGATVFKHWNPSSGKIVAQFVLQSELQSPSLAVVHIDYLKAAANRVVWFSAREGVYLEVSASGQVRKITGLQLPKPHLVTGMAVTDGGETLLSYQYGSGIWAVVRLNFNTRKWDIVETGNRSGPSTSLLGAEGDQIVAHSGGLWRDIKFLTLMK